ncbi:MAG: cyclic nucleotide-binding/CBS domain-containing protein [Candidatus Dormibacteria bacterium]
MPSSAATVAEAMRPRLPSCTLRTPVMEVARRMQDEGVRAMIVASAGSDLVAGVITDLDLLRAVIEGQTESIASDVMTLEPPPSVPAGDSLGRAVERLRSSGAELLLVTDGDPARPIGVLGYSDIALHLARGG